MAINFNGKSTKPDSQGNMDIENFTFTGICSSGVYVTDADIYLITKGTNNYIWAHPYTYTIYPKSFIQSVTAKVTSSKDPDTVVPRTLDTNGSVGWVYYDDKIEWSAVAEPGCTIQGASSGTIWVRGDIDNIDVVAIPGTTTLTVSRDVNTISSVTVTYTRVVQSGTSYTTEEVTDTFTSNSKTYQNVKQQSTMSYSGTAINYFQDVSGTVLVDTDSETTKNVMVQSTTRKTCTLTVPASIFSSGLVSYVRVYYNGTRGYDTTYHQDFIYTNGKVSPASLSVNQGLYEWSEAYPVDTTNYNNGVEITGIITSSTYVVNTSQPSRKWRTYVTGEIAPELGSLTCYRAKWDNPTSYSAITSSTTVYFGDRLYWVATAATGYTTPSVPNYYDSSHYLTVDANIPATDNITGTNYVVKGSRITVSYSQGTLPTGVSSITCYRKQWDSLTWDTTPFTGNTLYYGDQLYWTATPSTGYGNPTVDYNSQSNALTVTTSNIVATNYVHAGTVTSVINVNIGTGISKVALTYVNTSGTQTTTNVTQTGAYYAQPNSTYSWLTTVSSGYVIVSEGSGSGNVGTSAISITPIASNTATIRFVLSDTNIGRFDLTYVNTSGSQVTEYFTETGVVTARAGTAYSWIARGKTYYNSSSGSGTVSSYVITITPTVTRVSATYTINAMPTGIASISCYRKPWNGSSYSLFTGSTIYGGDFLYWTATAATGYNNPSVTYNSSSNHYTVSSSNVSNTSYVTAGGRKSYIYSRGTLPTGVSSLTAYRKPYNGSSYSIISTGSIIYYGDSMYFVPSASTGYMAGSYYPNLSSPLSVTSSVTGASQVEAQKKPTLSITKTSNTQWKVNINNSAGTYDVDYTASYSYTTSSGTYSGTHPGSVISGGSGSFNVTSTHGNFTSLTVNFTYSAMAGAMTGTDSISASSSQKINITDFHLDLRVEDDSFIGASFTVDSKYVANGAKVTLHVTGPVETSTGIAYLDDEQFGAYSTSGAKETIIFDCTDWGEAQIIYTADLELYFSSSSSAWTDSDVWPFNYSN